MKKIFTILLIQSSLFSFAQTPKSIVLKKGQSIIAITNATTNADLGMGTLNNEMGMTYQLLVIGESENAFTVTNTTTKIKMAMEGMGQNINYDSENPADKNSEASEALSGKLNASDTFSINKLNGSVIHLNKNNQEAAGGAGFGMIGAGENENQALSEAFLIIPANKNISDKWEQTVSTKGLTTKKIYTLKSIEKDIATIEMSGTIDGTTEQEMQGMTINVTMNTKFSGEITTNVKTGMVIKSTNNSDGTSTMDMMGQQVPITSKSSTTTSYN